MSKEKFILVSTRASCLSTPHSPALKPYNAQWKCLCEQCKLQRAHAIVHNVTKHVILISIPAYHKSANLYCPSEVVIVCGWQDNTRVVHRHNLSRTSRGSPSTTAPCCAREHKWQYTNCYKETKLQSCTRKVIYRVLHYCRKISDGVVNVKLVAWSSQRLSWLWFLMDEDNRRLNVKPRSMLDAQESSEKHANSKIRLL
jgi:hypothetical protein